MCDSNWLCTVVVWCVPNTGEGFGQVGWTTRGSRLRNAGLPQVMSLFVQSSNEKSKMDQSLKVYLLLEKGAMLGKVVRTDDDRRYSMNTLPWELVGVIVADCTPTPMWPVLRCVCHLWQSFVDGRARDGPKGIKHNPGFYGKHQQYRHACTTTRRCAVHYAKLAIDRDWGDIVEWMIDCAGPFGSINDVDEYACEKAVLDDDMNALKRWAARSGISRSNIGAWKRAARVGNLRMLEYVHGARRDDTFDNDDDKKVVCAGAKGGHLRVMQWLREKEYRSYTWTLSIAAKRGHFELVMWLVENKCPWDDCTMSAAVGSGRMDMVQWLHTHECPPDVYAFGRAAYMGRIDIMQWLHDNGRSTDARPWYMAACGGHIEVMVWLRAHNHMWETSIYPAAAINGHFHVIQWAKANGCPWNVSACVNAAWGNRIDILQWMREKGCDWNEQVCGCAAAHGNLEMLQWARATGCPWGEDVCIRAARGGHLHVLQWARANGCPWDAMVCRDAATHGYLHVLQWAHNNGCPWDESTCAYAARSGHLRILQWTRENGCPWNAQTCWSAATCLQVEVLEWALDNGCPYDADLVAIGNSTSHIELRALLQSHPRLLG